MGFGEPGPQSLIQTLARRATKDIYPTANRFILRASVDSVHKTSSCIAQTSEAGLFFQIDISD
jgi:hypothetical protein